MPLPNNFNAFKTTIKDFSDLSERDVDVIIRDADIDDANRLRCFHQFACYLYPFLANPTSGKKPDREQVQRWIPKATDKSKKPFHNFLSSDIMKETLEKMMKLPRYADLADGLCVVTVYLDEDENNYYGRIFEGDAKKV